MEKRSSFLVKFWAARVKAGTRRPSIGYLLRWAVSLVLLVLIIFNWYSEIPPHELATRYAFPDSHFMEIDSMIVHYRLSGRGEAVVLLHDAYSSLHTWTVWTERLSKNYQVISLDLPGFGLTGPHPHRSYSAFMYADFLERFTQALRLRRFHLVGNGLGAQIAWVYATQRPQRLRKLVLSNAPGFEQKNSSLLYWLARTPIVNRLLRRITPRAAVRAFLEKVYADDSRVTDALVRRHHDLLRRAGNRKAFTDRATTGDNRPPADLVENITIPTLIVWGAEDAVLSPEYAYEFHRRIRRALLRIYQNTGHWPQEENPEQSAADIEAFLEGRF
ncbi:MAG: alpha/beta hydrolase [Saprospiraceae bacterium]|nr:alpha/beta hydrolase [Saprospiraceae bacterium]MDW8482724.1 alpha/beta hydrolase [Saprospiraceae bacterium]